MLYTSWFANPQLTRRPELVKISIAVTTPTWPLGYELRELKALAPSPWMLKIKDETVYRGCYREYLDRMGVQAVRRMLRDRTGDRDAVLLCWEDLRKPGAWCHRRMFAEWWLENTGEEINELEQIPVQGELFPLFGG